MSCKLLTDDEIHDQEKPLARRSRWRRHGLLRAGGRQPATFRVAKVVLAVVGVTALTMLVAYGLLAARLSQGPIALDWLTPRIKSALEGHLREGYSFNLGDAALESSDNGPVMTFNALTLTDPRGQILLSAPHAVLAVHPLAVAGGNFVPERLELTGLDVKFLVAADGGVSISAGRAIDVAAPTPALESSSAPTVAAPPALSAPGVPPLATTVERGLKSLLDLVGDPESPFGVLDHFSIARGRLVFDDPRRGSRTVLDGLAATYDKDGAKVRVDVLVNGPQGAWSLKAEANGAHGAARSLQFEVHDISPDEIALALGLPSPPLQSDMPLSLRISAELGADERLTAAAGNFALGAGFVKAEITDRREWLIDEVTGNLVYDAAEKLIRIERFRLDAGRSHVELAGTVKPPIDGDTEWRMDLASGDAAVASARPGEESVALSRMTLVAQYDPSRQTMRVDNLALEGPEANVRIDALLTGLPDRPTLKLGLTAGRMPMRSVVRLWPAFAAPDARGWFQDHLHRGMLEGGTMRLDYDAATFAIARADGPLPDNSGRIDFSVSGASIDSLPGLPPFTNVDGSGRVTGRTANFAATRGLIDLGDGKKITVADAAFNVPEVHVKPAPATLALHVQTNMDSVSELLGRDALKSFHFAPPDTQHIKGQLDGLLNFDLKLSPKMAPDDIALHGNATVNAMSIDNFLAKEKLEGATIAFSLGKDGLKGKGEGRLLGGPATIELRKPGNGAGEATVGLTLDEAMRTRLGFAHLQGMSGSVGARVTAPLDQAEDPKAKVELDLSRLAIDGLVPGWSKPAGKPGKASFNLAAAKDGMRLDQIALDAGGLSLTGSAQLGADGKLVSAHLANVRIGLGDDMQVEASRGGEGLKLSIKGGSVDARPLLTSLVNQQAEGRGSGGDIDLDLRANALVGHNRQSLAGADIKLSLRAGQLRQLSVTGRFGADPLSVVMQRRDGPATIVLRTQDAGATLSFLDLYRRMRGGALDLSMRLADGKQDGEVTIANFTLKDEPAMQKFVAEGAAPAGNNGAPATLDPTSVPFTKLKAGFTRANGRIDIRDGVMFGQQIGATISGAVDFARNTVDLNGAFVPAYEVNNLFARVPLLGPLLGGNKNEGLFAVNYRVTGPASAPVLHVNPLSAIAPGFLRTIFGAMDGTRPPDAGPVGEASPQTAPAR